MRSKVKINVPRLQGISLSAYHPGKRRFILALSILAFVAIALGAYSFGSAGFRLPFSGQQQSVAELKRELKLADEKIHALDREVARLARSTTVELQAAEQIKGMLREKDVEIAKLTEELVFYRNLLAPEKAKAGIEIRDLQLRMTDNDREYYYDFLLTQSGRKNSVAKGDVNLTIDGSKQGLMHRLQVKNNQVSGKLNYSFKYFQRLSGVFTLPDDFEAKNISIEVAPANKKKPPLQLSYSWSELISGS